VDRWTGGRAVCVGGTCTGTENGGTDILQRVTGRCGEFWLLGGRSGITVRGNCIVDSVKGTYIWIYKLWFVDNTKVEIL